MSSEEDLAHGVFGAVIRAVDFVSPLRYHTATTDAIVWKTRITTLGLNVVLCGAFLSGLLGIAIGHEVSKAAWFFSGAAIVVLVQVCVHLLRHRVSLEAYVLVTTNTLCCLIFAVATIFASKHGGFGYDSQSMLFIGSTSAFLLAGLPSGLFWVGSSLLEIWVIFVLHEAEHPFEPVVLTSLQRAVAATLVCFALSGPNIVFVVLNNHLRAQVLRSSERAQAVGRAKMEFLAMMSHEIRTPLFSLLSFIDLVLEDKPLELAREHRDWLETAKRSGELLQGTVNDILDFSKIAAGKLKLEDGLVDIREVISSMCNSVSLTVANRQIEWLYDVDVEVPFQITGDALRIKQILANLVRMCVTCVCVWQFCFFFSVFCLFIILMFRA
jgi:hypothetical protein